MKVFHGIAASKGYAIGKLQVLQNMDYNAPVQKGCNPLIEYERVLHAQKKSIEGLKRVYKDAYANIGQEYASFFQIHIMMLQDEDYLEEIRSYLEQEEVNAEYAVWTVSHRFYEMFATMEDEYMRARSADVLDIANRLLCCLNPACALKQRMLKKGVILATNCLMPSEAVRIHRNHIVGVVTRQGSKSSHSSIIARTLGAPVVVGLGDAYQEVISASQVILDGYTGDVIVDPDEETYQKYLIKQERDHNRWKKLQTAAALDSITLDGTRIEVTASISSLEDLQEVLDSGAAGVGLFRSEFLYMKDKTPPTEEEQFEVYRTIAEKMDGKRVIIRTVDVAAAEKRIPFLQLKNEKNPALGYRGIRLSLDHKELLVTQLRAILRATIYGRIAVMFPLVTTLDEISQLKRIIQETKDSLRAEGVPFVEHMEVGIMIETPAAALISDLFVDEADFFCVGMNDFTQYILAADPMNPQVSGLYDEKHPAVLRLLKKTVENAKKNGLWVVVCGNSASYLSLLPFYLAIGVDELSVNPSNILEVRHAVQKMMITDHKDEFIQQFCRE